MQRDAMKMFLSILFVGVVAHAALSAENDAASGGPPPASAQKLVRVRFVPEKASASDPSVGGGASFSKLVPGPEKEMLLLQAHAGIGDKFPVPTEKGGTLFKVLLADGNDDRLVLEIIGGGTQKR